MTQDRKKIIPEIIIALTAMFLIIILFAVSRPAVFAADIALPFIIAFELSPFVLMAATAALICRIKKIPVSAGLGFDNKHFLKQILTAVIIFAVTILIIIIPLLCGADKSDVLSFKAKSPVILIYYVIKAIFFVGIGEELVWRGYFYERIKQINNSGVWAVIISSVLFGLWHYPIGQNIMQVIVVTGLGMIYGFARYKIKYCSTMATGIAHGLHDAAIVILSYILL